MIQDLLLAALGGNKALASVIESELAKLEKAGIPAAEVAEIGRELKARLEARAVQARETAGPVLDAARGMVRNALGVPSREELERLTERLERAIAALEKREKS